MSPPRTLVAVTCGSVLALAASVAHAQPQPAGELPTAAPTFVPPDQSYTYVEPQHRPTLGWALVQFVPSPQIGIGKAEGGDTQAAFGLRWQLTPVLWSWGVHRRLSGWRFFVVDPLARMSGSLAFETHFEFFGGHVDRLLARPGVKATFPLLHRGEYLAFSMGTSVYQYDDRAHVAHDVGLYMLYGILGAVATIAPQHDALTTIATLRIRYF